MAKVSGEVIETPTQEMPFKAVISSNGEVFREQFFATRPEAEAFVVDTLNELEKAPEASGREPPSQT